MQKHMVNARTDVQHPLAKGHNTPTNTHTTHDWEDCVWENFLTKSEFNYSTHTFEKLVRKVIAVKEAQGL